MTVQGAAELRRELDELQRVRRPRITKAIAAAREHGDLRENAEYHAAREEQSFCEGRIQEIESKLSRSEVIDVTTLPGTEPRAVVFGATVKLYDVGKDKSVTYRIVGQDEAQVSAGKISVESPIARALIGKTVGDEVTVTVPGGDIVLEIEAVDYL